MAAITFDYMPRLKHNSNGVHLVPGNKILRPCLVRSNSNLFGHKLAAGYEPLSFSASTENTRRSGYVPLCVAGSNQSSASCSFDVVIVGAGIIGLSIARQFLLGSDLSVAVIDAAVPCSGATGAGNAYVFSLLLYPPMIFAPNLQGSYEWGT